MNKKIAVLHTHCMLAVGGTTFMLQVCTQLAQGGWDVSIITVKSDPAIVANARQSGVKFIDVGGPLSSSIWFWLTYPFVYWRIHQATRLVNAPVVVCQVFPANWWGWFYKILHPSIKLVYVCHEPTAFIFSKAWIDSVKPEYMRQGLKLFNPILRWVEQTLIPMSDIIEVNSHYSEREVIDTFPKLNTQKIRLIYGGVDHQLFRLRPYIKREPVILMIGVLTKFKNTALVIRAFHSLWEQENYKHIKLIIKGKGVEKESLLALSNQLGIGNAVEIIDKFYDDEELATLISGSHVFVHAAHNEPFGLSVIEALACGTPAIVTGTGGTGETVIDQQSGLYFRSGDVADLANKLAILFDDQPYWQKLSDGAVEQAGKFTWEQTDAKFCQLLNDVMNEPVNVV